MCVTCLIYMCDMTHSYVWRDSFICVLVLSAIWNLKFGDLMCVRMCVMTNYLCDMTHLYVWYDSFICVTWLIRMCDVTHLYVWWCYPQFEMWRPDVCLYVRHDESFVWHMTHLYVWHDSFICVTWLIHVCDMTHSYVWRDSFICVLVLSAIWILEFGDLMCVRMCVMSNHMCDMTHSYVSHDSFICVTWLIHVCDMTRSYVWHDSFICVTWLIHVCDMTHSCVWHDSFVCVTWLIYMCAGAIRNLEFGIWNLEFGTWRPDVDSFKCVTWLVRMCDITHVLRPSVCFYVIYKFIDTHTRTCVHVNAFAHMGWLRLVGLIKL